MAKKNQSRVKRTVRSPAGSRTDITARQRVEEALRESEARYRELFEAESDAVFLIDNATGNILEANSAAAALYGYSQGELLTKRNVDLSAEPEETQRVTHGTPISSEQVVSIPLRYHRKKDGTVFPVEITGRFFIRHGRPVHIAAIRDITARKQAETELHIALEKYRVLFESFPLGISITDAGGNLIEANRESERLLGIPRDEHTRRKYDGPEWRIVRPDGTPMPADEYASVRALKEKRLVENVEMGIVKGGGEITWISVTAAPIPLEGYGVAITYGDVTAHKQAEEALRVKEWAIESAINALAISNLEGNLEYVNPAFLKLWGYRSQAEVLGKSATGFWQAGEKAEEVIEALRARGGWSGEMVAKSKDGSLLDVQVAASLVRDAIGQPVRMLASFVDITDLKQALARERHLARTDALTGVNNHRYWLELAEHEFQVATRYRPPISVIMFDIDDFKLVNDTFGHAVGDQMLERVAQVARAALRSVDVIGRYGGEEFVIVLPVTNGQQAYSVAERIRTGVAAIRVPTPKGDAAVTLSLCIAEALLAERPGGDESVEAVVRRADRAMYAAKATGRNRTSIYSAPTEYPGESAEEQSILPND